MKHAARIVVIAIVVLAMVGTRLLDREDSSEAHRLVADGALLIDVRSPAEFAAGHLDGAVNIPVDQIEQRSAEIGPTDRPVVVYCRSGTRSAAAAAALARQGFVEVEDLGAISNW